MVSKNKNISDTEEEPLSDIKKKLDIIHNSEIDIAKILRSELSSIKNSMSDNGPESTKARDTSVLVKIALLEKSVETIENWIEKHDDKYHKEPKDDLYREPQGSRPDSQIPVLVAETTGKFEVEKARHTSRWQAIGVIATAIITFLMGLITLISNIMRK